MLSIAFIALCQTRRRIVDIADRLFYEHGFEATSFADIASDAGLSRGNFYYHFRTKDEILNAVIALRLANTRAMLDAWEKDSKAPADRIRSLIHILIANRTKVMAHGCPVGTLCSELAKLDHLAKDDAASLFILFRDWLSGQFTRLGREADADALAFRLLMRSQGVATLAMALRDEQFIRRDGVLAACEMSCPLGPGRRTACLMEQSCSSSPFASPTNPEPHH